MKILVTLFLFFIISCGEATSEDFIMKESPKENTDPRLFKSIDDRLLVYVMEFEIFYRKEVTIPIGIKKVENTSKGVNRRVIGKCVTWSTGHREIYIDEEFYKENKDNYHAMQFLIFHELGHCVLNRDHDDSRVEKNGLLIEKSIMHSLFFGKNPYYGALEDYYIDELFKGD